MMLFALALVGAAIQPPPSPPAVVRHAHSTFAALGADESPFQRALSSGADALERGEPLRARAWIQRALERDPRSIAAWDLHARWAQTAEDEDELVYALHKMLGLAIAQRRPKDEQAAIRERLAAADPISGDLLGMRQSFTSKLFDVAQSYEKERRPHSAIAAYREVIALDPENAEAAAAIERIASQPDPSLAEDATPKDLFEDVSEEWIREHDEKHATWSKKASFESEYYNVKTNAGYRILIQAADAMDKMHVFYKRFFGVEGSVARIELLIFRTHDEYLKLGSSPSEWSGGQFTGGAVETYVHQGGFQETLSTLFHEAGHQFVNRATSAGGWLNEGLASFFEGTRLLANGTVRMNLPALHRLAPLTQRLERGWMKDAKDGTDDKEPNRIPSTAPGFDLVLENAYTWGPAWYAPTWGVVYFCYNYQDPADGRFVYRKAFADFLNKSGGRSGDSAVANFEEVVLAKPLAPTPGVESSFPLPETVAELNPIWKDWILRLRDEYDGSLTVERPYLKWARYAVERKEYEIAAEHFEDALLAASDDPEVLVAFAEFLASQKQVDRAVKLVLRALRVLEDAEQPDKTRIAQAEKLLGGWDPSRKTLDGIHADLWSVAQNIVRRYMTAGRHMMAMELAWRFTADLRVPDLMPYYEQAWRQSKKSLHLWKLAYNEKDLEGWSAPASTSFLPKGEVLEASLGRYAADDFGYEVLPMDIVTAGDYSIEVDVLARSGEVGFSGIVFGLTGGSTFNALIYLPGKGASGGLAGSGFLDLSGFRGGAPLVWRHVPVAAATKTGESVTDAEWKRLRLDVTGPFADVYIDGELVVVHEFPSARSASGGLGLIVGRGQARYRNVRYLARSPRDPGARLERAVKMEAYAGEEQSIGGSWLGKVPPFPKVQGWLAGERTSWKEVGPVPQLLVMWSQRQNDLIPINDWLAWLEEKYRDMGLAVVCIASVEDTQGVASYLERRPFPGVVGLDGAGVNLGDTFEAYGIGVFNLPRLILLDIDARVVWEGDPGLRAGSRWSPGGATFLDAPLEELVGRRNLRALSAWRSDWTQVALPAMHDGDFAKAKPILQAASRFEAKGDTDVFDAQTRLAALKSALASVDSTVASLEREGCEPALDVLLEWGKVLGIELDARTKKQLRSVTAGPGAVEWNGVREYLKGHLRRVKKDGAEGALAALRAELAQKRGRFASVLLGRLEGVGPEGVDEVIAGAARIPETWLAREYFSW